MRGHLNIHKRRFGLNAVLLCAAIGLLLGFMPACANVPSAPGGVQKGTLASSVHDGITNLYMQDLRTSLQASTNLASSLARSHRSLEELCANSRETDFATNIATARAEHAEILKGSSEKISRARKSVERGKDWISRQVGQSEDEAEAIAAAASHLSQAQHGLDALEELSQYETALFATYADLDRAPTDPRLDQVEEYYNKTWGAHGMFLNITPAPCLKDLHERSTALWETLGTYYYTAFTENVSSELDRRTLLEMTDWGIMRDAVLAKQSSWVAARQYSYAAELMAGKVEEDAMPEVEFRCIERVSPNLYQSLDSALDITITTPSERDVIVEVEIAGFSLAHTTKISLLPGVNYFRIKPEMLPRLQAADLERASTTQINFKMTDVEGTIIEQQSKSVEILSLYDYIWENDDFGFAAQFELFAWLRPGQEGIDSLNRRAAEYMGDWTDGQFAEINGYQYGQDWYATLIQVAAIQKAFSDSGIAYIIDTYTPTADQRVLTASAVFERKQALCIESSLVIASAILSAGMHPMIIITPGHAQVAVETWAGSGQYFLIETSTLPYGGLDREVDSASSWAYGGLVPVYDDGAGSISWVESLGSSDTWVRYFNWVEDFDSDNYGGIFVLDCNLQRIMGIRGLEAM